MNGWNQPTVLPRQPGLMEQLRPSIVSFLSTLAVMKMGQKFQAGQAEIAATRAATVAKTRFGEEMFKAGAEEITPQAGPLLAQNIEQGGDLGPGYQKGPYGRVWKPRPTLADYGLYSVGNKLVQIKMEKGKPVAKSMGLQKEFSEPIMAKEGDPKFAPGTVYMENLETGATKVIQSPVGYKAKTKAEALELRRAGAPKITIGQKAREKDLAAVKSINFMSDVAKDVMRLNKDEWELAEAPERADMVREEADRRVRNIHPGAQFGRGDQGTGWYEKKGEEFILVVPWNE